MLLELALASFGLYGLYYLFIVVKKPKIYSHPSSSLVEKVKEWIPIFSRAYWPPPWGFGRHFTTVLRSARQSSVDLIYMRDVIALTDGGKIALDWAADDVFETDKTVPVLLILPGLTGSSLLNYVTHLSNTGIKCNYRPVVMNQRGIANIPMGTPKCACATSTADLRVVVEFIRQRNPQAPIIGVGVSLGGMILTKYLADYPGDEHLTCVITLCAPWDLFATRSALDTFPSKQIYNRYLAKELKDLLLRRYHEFDPKDVPLDVNSEEFQKLDTVQDFDRMVTIRCNGYSTLEDYYVDGSNASRVSGLTRVPLIAINSLDDPFVPAWSLPVKEFQQNPKAVLIVTSRGGHFGFLEGWKMDQPTWLDRAVHQCLEMIQAHMINKSFC